MKTGRFFAGAAPPGIALALLAGCTTLTYTSDRPGLEVAQCIAAGWREVPSSGYKLPVSLSEFPDYRFVGVELLHYYGPLPSGTKHPNHTVWAEVRDVASGSTTEYHRAYQFSHARIDRVVTDCQGSRP